jgi:AraC-like DNA-binding protein
MGHISLVATHAIKPMIGAAAMPTPLLERFAERAGLPGWIVEDSTGYVPLHATESFLNIVHRNTGDPAFLFNSLGIDVDEKRETHAVVGIPLPVGVTGKEAVQMMSDTFNGYISGSRFYCEIRDDLLWVERTASATEWSDVWPVVQYNLSVILVGVRRVLGRHLRPKALHLSQAPAKKDLPDDLRDVAITLNRERYGMAFNLMDVVSAGFSLKKSGRLPDNPPIGPATGDKLDAVSSCLSQFVMSSTTDRLSERVSRSFGLSERSYRRQLAQMGTSHSRLLADIRLDLALKLLADDSIAVTNIAVELGYAHVGDFTRFLKGRMGCSPTEYRRGVLGCADIQ